MRSKLAIAFATWSMVMRPGPKALANSARYIGLALRRTTSGSWAWSISTGFAMGPLHCLRASARGRPRIAPGGKLRSTRLAHCVCPGGSRRPRRAFDHPRTQLSDYGNWSMRSCCRRQLGFKEQLLPERNRRGCWPIIGRDWDGRQSERGLDLDSRAYGRRRCGTRLFRPRAACDC